MNVEECLEKFTGENSHRLTERTINLYRIAIRQMLAFCEKPLEQITTLDVRNWLLQLDKNRYQQSTIKLKLSGLKVFFNYCQEEKIIIHNPVIAIPFPEVDEKLPHYLQRDQLMKLRKLVERKTEERALVELLYTTGMRIGEVAAMKKEDILWEERIIHIRKAKNNKDRIVLFTQSCAEYLKEHVKKRQDNQPYVFVNAKGTGPICVTIVQRKFRTYNKKLGFSFTPHTLRHTFAAHLAIKGMPLDCIQALLGHDSPYQTRLYARLYSAARKQKYDEWT